jgi:hypothetical protein
VQVWIFVWLMSSLITVAFLAVAVAAWIVQPAIQIGRAAQRFQAETAELTEAISKGAARAGDRPTRDRERAAALGRN